MLKESHSQTRGKTPALLCLYFIPTMAALFVTETMSLVLITFIINPFYGSTKGYS